MASKRELIWRWLASKALSDQSIPASGLAPNRMNSLTVSAPNLEIISSGLTVFPRDLLIFADLLDSSLPQDGQADSK